MSSWWSMHYLSSASPLFKKTTSDMSNGSINCSGVTNAAPSYCKKVLLLIICLAVMFSSLVYYTHPIHSTLYTATAAAPHSYHQLPNSRHSSSSSSRHTVDSGGGGYYSSNKGIDGEDLIPAASLRADYDDRGDDDRPPRLRVQGTQRRLPKALIIGVRKCGTRALIEMLNLHPDIRKRDAEMHFFDNDDRYMNGLEWYRKKMPYSFDNQITIEKTPSYFVSRDAPARIKAMDADTKLLLIVREPAMRVLSDYVQIMESKKAKGAPFKPFHKLVMLPNGDINDGYSAVQISQYVVHILRWLRTFSRDQIHIVDGDMLIHNPYSEMRKIEMFLELPAKIKPSNFYFNRTKGFYCMRNETHQKCLADSKGRRHPYVDPSIMMALRRYFVPFNDQFYQIVGQNFTWPTF